MGRENCCENWTQSRECKGGWNLNPERRGRGCLKTEHYKVVEELILNPERVRGCENWSLWVISWLFFILILLIRFIRFILWELGDLTNNRSQEYSQGWGQPPIPFLPCTHNLPPLLPHRPPFPDPILPIHLYMLHMNFQNRFFIFKDILQERFVILPIILRFNQLLKGLCLK